MNAHQRKSAKYNDLLESSSANSYNTTLITLEVRSRGFINICGFKAHLEHFSYSKWESISLLRAAGREAILQSHGIWTARNKLTDN